MEGDMPTGAEQADAITRYIKDGNYEAAYYYAAQQIQNTPGWQA